MIKQKTRTWRWQCGVVSLLTAFVILTDISNAQVPASTITFPESKNSVEIPFTRYRGWIIVHMKVNDSKLQSFILDTGAPIAVLADKDAGESLGLTVAGQAMVAGGEGQPPKSVPLATGVRFTLGELEIGNCMVAIGAASEAISGVDGVIGKYVFENTVVEINWKESKLIITKPEHFTYKGKGEIIPFKMATTGHIYGETLIEKNGRKKTLQTVFDLGNRSGLKMNNLAPGEIYTDEEAIKNIITGWGANGSATGDVTRVNLSLGRFRFSDVVASSDQVNGRLEQEGITGNIGLSILDRFNMIFDYTQGRLILEKNENYTRDFFYTMSGILLSPKREQDHVLVAGTVPHSPASAAGLKKDDKLIAINGRAISDYSADEVDDLVSGKTKKEIDIEINRQGEVLKKKIIMKKLI